jgi:hypothetical protein
VEDPFDRCADMDTYLQMLINSKTMTKTAFLICICCLLTGALYVTYRDYQQKKWMMAKKTKLDPLQDTVKMFYNRALCYQTCQTRWPDSTSIYWMEYNAIAARANSLYYQIIPLKYQAKPGYPDTTVCLCEPMAWNAAWHTSPDTARYGLLTRFRNDRSFTVMRIPKKRPKNPPIGCIVGLTDGCGDEYFDGKKWIKINPYKRFWTPSCEACNGYIESHHRWAQEQGFKISRHSKNSLP